MENIYLSERNLRVLLSKLERAKAGEATQCTIIKYRDENSEYKNSMNCCMIVALPDSEVYKNRQPGPMNPKDLE